VWTDLCAAALYGRVGRRPALACHSAVRAGDTLTNPEMEEVIRRWLACKLPWTCPHGRPIAHTISKGELNHFFHRPSLPVSAI